MGNMKKTWLYFGQDGGVYIIMMTTRGGLGKADDSRQGGGIKKN